MVDFILRAARPQEEGENWYVLNIFRNELQERIQIHPMPDSIVNGHLEWVIPGISYNRTLARVNYPSFTVTDITEEIVSKPPVKKKVIKEKAAPKIEALEDIEPSPNSPLAIRKLKLSIMKELKALGVDYPNGCNLKKLQDIWEEAKAAKE